MSSNPKIGELLVQSGALREEDLQKALEQRHAFGPDMPLGEVMLVLKLITPAALARALAVQYNLPFVQLPEIPAGVSRLVPLEYQIEHRLIPFRVEAEGRDERLHLAIADPSQLAVVDELRFQLRKQVRVYVAALDDIENALAGLRGEKMENLEPFDVDEQEAAPLIGTEVNLEVEEVDWNLPTAPPSSPSAEPGVPPPPPFQGEEGAGLFAPPLLEDLEVEDLLGGPPMPPTPRPVSIITFPPAAPPAFRGSRTPPPLLPAEALVERSTLHPEAPTPLPAPPPSAAPAAASASLKISEEDLKILDDLERLSQGGEPSLESEKVKPARMVASLIRLLIRKGVIHEVEFLEELTRK